MDGWTLQQLLHVDVRVNKINPLKASSYIPLPKEIEAKKAVLNIQNTDQKCFVWSVLAAFHPVPRTQNANRVQNYHPFEQELDVTGIDFPISLKQLPKFEQLNNISINVYGLEKGYKHDRNIIEVVGPLYFTRSHKTDRHVNLLLISDDSGNNHYCLIRNMSRLISKQLSGKQHSKFLCDGCLVYFSSDIKLENHQKYDCGHVVVETPSDNLKKNKYGENIPENILKFTNFERKLKSIFKTFRGPDAHKVFIDWLETGCKSIYNRFMKDIVSMSPLSSVQEAEFYQMTHCHICESPFNVEDERVRDHCHLTGNYRGATHSVCNLNFKVPNFIPVFFHNMSNFDSHLFIKELAVEEERLDVIPQNKERYISFTKYIMVGDDDDGQEKRQQKIFLKLRFLDSFRFMASSLDKLSQNLTSQQCRESYVDSFSKLDDTKLPPIDGFYNKLRKEAIKQGDYERALNNFREVCLQTYGLDPCQYFTAPSLSFDAALKTTSIELELLTDLDMIHFFKHGIRGGVSQCSVRKAIANNKFMSIYDASKPTSYIMYLDATNLYGAAMSQYLPTGYVFEVDLEYPEYLHDLHNELPFCPESVQPEGSKVSN
ncbi:uncharacterized protein LOC115885288 [Sitophilus oryzae]|uniref:Uncharacterized protein LOC115885288 n=1 Tax=Sitophilus oryzae TaxID=7048 RepID=A0A6J2Y919_SITOR|nr:uncharacterized protein LOC115885288 [Sitophilus oryzae]